MSDDQLGPWMINPKNTEGRYLVFDNLYNEMRLIGGVAKVEPSDRICLVHGATASLRDNDVCWQKWNGYVDTPHGTGTDCKMVDVVRVPKEDS